MNDWEEQLKPCPFCGEKEPVRLMVRLGKDGWRDRFYILCEYDSGGCGSQSGWYHTPNAAIDSWNIRNWKA